MRRRTASFALLIAAATLATAQQPDIVSVRSPNGRIEFQLSNTAPTRESLFTRLAYRVLVGGKPLMDTSYIVFAIQDQEPMLGEKLGLMYSTRKEGVDEKYTFADRTIRNQYNAVIANYLQSGTLGRSLSVEVRAYDDGIAFRYFLPRSVPLEDLRIEEEETDFNLAQDGRAYALADGKYAPMKISALKRASLVGLPFLVEQPGIGWVEITEAQVENYAGMNLFHAEGTTMRTTLPPLPDDAALAVHGTTPVDLPWRVVMIASEPRKLLDSDILLSLNPPSAIADTSWIKPAKRYVSLRYSEDLDKHLDQQFAQIESGSGVKLDLLHRADQPMMAFRRRAAKAAAERHLMIEFDNGPTPDGIERTFPNVIPPEDTPFRRLLRGL